MLCLSRCRWPEVPCQNSTRRKPGEPSWCRWPSDRGTGLRGSGPARPGLQTPGLRTAASPPPQPTPPPLARAARHRVARPPLVVVQFGNGQTLTASCSPARQVGAGAGLEARP